MSKVAEMKKPISLKLPVVITKENFTTDDNRVIKYYSYSIEVGDESFRLQAKPEDKKLLNYLLNDLFDNDIDENGEVKEEETL